MDKIVGAPQHQVQNQEHLRWLPRAVEREVEHGLDPHHLGAVARRHVELREGVGHDGDEAGACVEVQGHDDVEEGVTGKGRRHALPLDEEVGGGLPELTGQDDPKVSAASASDGPEEVRLHGGPVEEPPLGVHHGGVEDVVGGEAVLPQHQVEAAAAEVPTDADRRANASGEPKAGGLVGDGVVHLAEHCAGADPRCLATDVGRRPPAAATARPALMARERGGERERDK
ncbi:hypothetical protein DAI22_09g056950 [Oryza sativa Japonica Group]|nr:hypothetical protein DAI22_09g056950 [Oryza sativa Japonica Group]